MSVFNNQTFRHPSDAFSYTNHALLAPRRAAFEFGTCQKKEKKGDKSDYADPLTRQK
jgi:hypothetical protein